MTAVDHTRAGTGQSAVTVAPGNLADVTERLMAEFEDRFDLATISRVVGRARHDLQPVPDGALPELVERLARQRLLDRPTGELALPRPR